MIYFLIMFHNHYVLAAALPSTVFIPESKLTELSLSKTLPICGKGIKKHGEPSAGY